jgi:hypothetical protein
MQIAIIRLRANLDRNGNPRRVYVAIQRGEIVATWDEGYAGYQSVPEPLQHLAHIAPTIDTTPKEYKRLVRIGEGIALAAAFKASTARSEVTA